MLANSNLLLNGADDQTDFILIKLLFSLLFFQLFINNWMPQNLTSEKFITG